MIELIYFILKTNPIIELSFLINPCLFVFIISIDNFGLQLFNSADRNC